MGLLDKGGTQVPLTSVVVKARILDLASEVVILQKFRNESGEGDKRCWGLY